MSFVHEDLRHGEGIELVDIPTRDMTEADSRISEKSALSTTANNRERKRAGLTTVPQQEARDDDDDDDDDVDDGVSECLIIDHVTGCRSAVTALYGRHRSRFRAVFLTVLVLLYFAYFGYALSYQFGDEGSVRLLWVTCLVVVMGTLSLVRRRLLPQQKRSTLSSTPVNYIRQHRRQINWVVLAILYTFLLIFVAVDVTVHTKSYYNLVSLSGIFLFISLMLVFSVAPRKVNWQTVLWGIGLQFVFAIVVLRWPAGYAAFKWLGDRVSGFIKCSDAGAEFVFGASYRDHFVAFQVLPVIIFLSSVVSVLFYLGVMQYVITKLAWLMHVTMATTAAESLSAAANIFLGMADAPLAIRPMLPYLTRSEIHAVMTGGFATIAGSVLAAYIMIGVPANHLLSASFMSAPAALAISKLSYPETRKSRTTVKDMKQLMPKRSEVNVIEAATAGASNAISLVANIAANVIAFWALFQFVNSTLTWFGQRVGVDQLTYQLISSYVLWPLAVVMGVNVADCRKVAQMIGTKTFLNEFVAYSQLSQLIANRETLERHVTDNGTWHWRDDDVILTSRGSNHSALLTNGFITQRSELISTYVLCGFGSLSVIGIQLGALGAMAPTRRKDFALVVLRAMIAGNVACFVTACIAALFFQDV